MGMNMTLDEKIKRVVAIIDEAITVQKTNPVYVPTLYFKPENVGFPSPRDVFRVLQENGAIKKLTKWWGCDLIEESGKRVFEKTSSEEPQTDDDFEVYEIEVVTEKLAQVGRDYKQTVKSKDDVEFDELNGSLTYRKLHYTFQKGRTQQLRLKLFRELWGNRKIIQGGKTKRKGEPIPLGALAVRMEMLPSSQGFEKNKNEKAKLDALIKNIETNIQRKDIPLRIYKAGGIQIIVGAE